MNCPWRRPFLGIGIVVIAALASLAPSARIMAQPPMATLPAGPSIHQSDGPIASDESLRTLATSLTSISGTEVPVPVELRSLFTRGEVPMSIEQLRLLERQQRGVANSAGSCTVSVQIGPAQGCGVIITESGYILTAAHVAMRPNKRASVTLSNGRAVRATTLGMNRNFDAGLMKIDPNQNNGRPWPHATLGTSKELVAGMWCIATGHPGGYDHARGPVTRVGRILRARPDAIETDCALIGGDSGGPLFDLSGKLIAVHSRIGNDVSENLHVPVDVYGVSWDRLRKSEAWGFLPGFRPVLGVTGNQNSERAVVDIVRTGSPAEEAGIQPSDVIEQFGDVSITDFDSLKAAVSDTMPGERVQVWINRNGKSIKLSVEVGRDE